jgi:hypothetical protein
MHLTDGSHLSRKCLSRLPERAGCRLCSVSPIVRPASQVSYYRTEGVNRIDLGGAIVAPGFLELQTNGLRGVHFTQLGEKDDDEAKLLKVAQSQVQCGVTAFWCTIPTVEEGSWGKVRPLPFLNDPGVLVSFFIWTLL